MRPVKTALFAVALLVIATVALPAARADTTTFVPTAIASSPGTLAGTADALARIDATRVTWTETDTSGVAGSGVLMPDSVRNPWFFEAVRGCGGGLAQWACIDELPQDANVTYVSDTAAGNPQTGTYTTADWTGPADIVIAGVGAFMWARKNQSTNPQFTLDILWSPNPGVVHVCLPQTAPLVTAAFANWSTALFPNRCDGAVGWTVADLNDLVVDINVVHPVNNAIHEAVTSAGAVVSFTRHDFAVDAYINFTGLTGTAPVLSYTGSQSLPGGETAALQVNRAGTWTTVVTPFLGAVEATAQYVMDPALDVAAGIASFRIVDSNPSDATGGTLALDQFVITTTTAPGGGGGGILGALRLDCTPQFFATVACTATLSPLAVGVSILGSSWFVDGRYQKEGSGGVRSRSAVLDAFVFPAGTVNVTVRLSFDNGQVLYLSKEVRLDNSWILLLVLLAIVAFIVAALALYARKHGKKGKSKEQTWDEEYGFWGGIFK